MSWLAVAVHSILVAATLSIPEPGFFYWFSLVFNGAYAVAWAIRGTAEAK